MAIQFNKQAFEDKVYELVTAEVNAVLPELVKSGGNVLMFQRQFLQAMHFAIEESVVQNMYGWMLISKGEKLK